jgi:hypothetical protein
MLFSAPEHSVWRLFSYVDNHTVYYHQQIIELNLGTITSIVYLLGFKISSPKLLLDGLLQSYRSLLLHCFGVPN